MKISVIKGCSPAGALRQVLLISGRFAIRQFVPPPSANSLRYVRVREIQFSSHVLLKLIMYSEECTIWGMFNIRSTKPVKATTLRLFIFAVITNVQVIFTMISWCLLPLWREYHYIYSETFIVLLCFQWYVYRLYNKKKSLLLCFCQSFEIDTCSWRIFLGDCFDKIENV